MRRKSAECQLPEREREGPAIGNYTPPASRFASSQTDADQQVTVIKNTVSEHLLPFYDLQEFVADCGSNKELLPVFRLDTTPTGAIRPDVALLRGARCDGGPK